MTAVDTNVLFYAHDSREKEKQKIAIRLVASLDDGVLVWQVACEYLWASRKLEPFGYSYLDAVEAVRNLRQAWSTALPEWAVLDRMERLKTRYQLSFWDGLLIATCLEAGVDRLFSEDFGAYGKIDSLEIINPF